MNILITGGLGFIGRHAAERFHKEGHSVYIVDKAAATDIKYRHYSLDIADPRCEEVFRIHNIECVVHLAVCRETEHGGDDALAITHTNIHGLANMLDLARKYRVARFVFASSAAVYDGSRPIQVSEADSARPATVFGWSKLIGEQFCHKWRELYGLDTVVLRLSGIYGPGQSTRGEGGVVAHLLESLLCGRPAALADEAAASRDLLFVSDAVDALFRAACGPLTVRTLNIGADAAYDAAYIRQLLEGLGADPAPAPPAPAGYGLRLKTAVAREYLGWAPKYDLGEGLGKTLEWFREKQWQPPGPAKPGQWEVLKKWQPYLENLGVFAAASLLSFFPVANDFLDFRLGFDYFYAYIVIMGLLYGKRQSLLATLLAAAAFTAGYLGRGGDLVAMVYQIEAVIHLAVYLCIGVVTGYVTDTRDRRLADIRSELETANSRFAFLSGLYKECSQLKDDLFTQVVNSEDSLGKIYAVVRELDSLETEDIYTAAATIVAKIMKAGSVSVYTLNADRSYLRKKTGLGPARSPNSIKVANTAYVGEVLDSKKVFVNREMCADCPLVVAPIVHDNRVIAMITVDDLPFESLSLYHVNLLRILAMLVTDALARAYLFDEGLHDRRYVEGTRILKAAEFDKVLAAIAKRRELHGLDAALMKLTAPIPDLRELSEKLAGVVRAEDYVGMTPDGRICLLLLNTAEGTVEDVQRRLGSIGVDAVEVRVHGNI